MRRLLLLTLVVLAGCGGSSPRAPDAPQPVSLALDFAPNAVHAPIFAALRGGHDRAHGIRLRVRRPGSGPDALKLVAGGKVDVGLLDIHDLAIARAGGADLVAVAALVDRPLAALIARPGIRRPRDLEGRTVGVSGLPSDPAFLRAILEHDGGDYDRVRQVTIGFTAVTRLLSGRVDAVPAFWNVEGVELRRRGLRVREFRVEDYGAPPYPEVVVITSRRTLTERRQAVERTIAALRDGMRATFARPDDAARAVAAAARGEVAPVRAQLDALRPVFARDLRLDRQVLEAWADFDARIGIVDERPDVDRAFDFGF